MAELIEMLFGLWTPVGPMKHVLDGGPDPLCKGAILGDRTCPGILMTLCHELCKSSCTDRDTVWVVGSGGLKEPCIRCGPYPREKEELLAQVHLGNGC